MADVEQAFRDYLKANPAAGGDFTFFRAGWEAAVTHYGMPTVQDKASSHSALRTRRSIERALKVNE